MINKINGLRIMKMANNFVEMAKKIIKCLKSQEKPFKIREKIGVYLNRTLCQEIVNYGKLPVITFYSSKIISCHINREPLANTN